MCLASTSPNAFAKLSLVMFRSGHFLSPQISAVDYQISRSISTPQQIARASNVLICYPPTAFLNLNPINRAYPVFTHDYYS